MKLFFHTIGEGRPLLVLHGFLGSSDNWLSHARILSEHFKVYLIDQRNHGHSPHHPEHTYDAMASDLLELIASENMSDVFLLGHSMGGKTIMRAAQIQPSLISKMIVADMGIKGYRSHHEEVFSGLLAVEVEHCESRKQAEERLLPFVSEASTRQFLLKNLYWKEPGKLAWRFNLPVLYEQRLKTTEALPAQTINTPVHFIIGGKSSYVRHEDKAEIMALIPQASFAEIENAGHWVHADAPEMFRQEVLSYLL